jgi:type IV secretory pathway protease TraF
LLLFAAVPILVVCALGWAGLRFNATPSVPTGLYWVGSDPAAAYVEFYPPEPFGTFSAARGYRPRSAAACPDGGVPLLKPVVARSGDIVEVSARGIRQPGSDSEHGAQIASIQRAARWSLGQLVVTTLLLGRFGWRPHTIPEALIAATSAQSMSRVLVIDDELTIRNQICEALRSWSINVIGVGTLT